MKFLVFKGDSHAFGFVSCSLAFGVRQAGLRPSLITRVSRGYCGSLGSTGFLPHEVSGFIARPPLGLGHLCPPSG